MIKSLQVKLLISLVAIVMIAVAVAGFSMRVATRNQFNEYIRQGQELKSRNALNVLTSYYATVGDWNNVQPIVERLGQVLGVHLTIVDNFGRISGDSKNQGACNRMYGQEYELKYPITIGGTTVGKLYVNECMAQEFPTGIERDFLRSVNNSLIWTGLIALLVAIGLSVYVSRRITSPLLEMTKVVHKIQDGDLADRIQVKSSDEVGELSIAFNQMAESIQKTEQFRRDMIADVAHELRTPLTMIRGNLEAMQDGVIPMTKESLDKIHEETILLNRLVDDMRDLSLAEAGELALHRQSTDILEFIKRGAESISARAKELGIDLIVEASENLPELSLDIGRFSQVLRNLLSNALRFTGAGGSIAIKASRSEDDVLIEVEDTGTGINAEDLPYIFERFYRADKSRARATGGAGIGLTIAKRLIRAHGGSISVASEPGKGAKFTIRLPIEGEAKS